MLQNKQLDLISEIFINILANFDIEYTFSDFEKKMHSLPSYTA